MEGVELVMATEEDFGISISDAEAGAVTTPRMLIDLVLEKAPQRSRDEVAALVKEIVMEGLGVDEEDYGEDKDFVRDLGLQ